jgi:hypothetical protein
MASVLTPEMAYGLEFGYPRGLFVAIEHPAGTGYFCTGVGSRTWNGHTWNGTGTFGSVTPIKRTSEVAVQDIVFTLSGIDAGILNDLDDAVRGLNGSAWLFCINPSDDSVVADPYPLINSELDYQSLTVDSDGKASISITAHSGFYTLARSIAEAWTPENQKLAYPTDTGLDLLPSLQNQDLQWTQT